MSTTDENFNYKDANAHSTNQSQSVFQLPGHIRQPGQNPPTQEPMKRKRLSDGITLWVI